MKDSLTSGVASTSAASGRAWTSASAACASTSASSSALAAKAPGCRSVQAIASWGPTRQAHLICAAVRTGRGRASAVAAAADSDVDDEGFVLLFVCCSAVDEAAVVVRGLAHTLALSSSPRQRKTSSRADSAVSGVSLRPSPHTGCGAGLVGVATCVPVGTIFFLERRGFRKLEFGFEADCVSDVVSAVVLLKA